MPARYALSIDVGGTFTDLVLVDLDAGTPAALHKVLTDAARPARAVIAGVREIVALAGTSAADLEYIVHSTTIVTNAIIERRGARTALLTTEGFRDVLEIGIEQIYDIYDLFAAYPAPLIPRERRREVRERVTRDGAVLTPLDEAAARATIADLVADGAESIAVSLLHAYRNPAHEERLAELIAEVAPDVAVSLASRVAPLIGEYERTSTVAADAYVKPLLRRYLADLVAELRALGFGRQLYLMLSSGGITTAETAMVFPIRLLESGPAAGAFAASFFGRLAGHEHVLSLDMGGTTAKACLIEGGVPGVARMLEADRVHRFKPGSGLPIMAPTVDLIEIGAGGGSIAHVNALGLLNVGPQSAESRPGPACYALGGDRPTVTDANVLLGYLDPAYFLGGRIALDAALAGRAIAGRVAAPLGLSARAAAWGIHAIVNENMARAARTHLIERNRDPRDVALVAFGGAGPAHAVAVARLLGIGEVIVPFGAGVASAIGALTAPLAVPFVRSYMTLLDECDWAFVRRLYDAMRSEADAAFAGAPGRDQVIYRRAVELRYAGQYHELRLPLPDAADGPAAGEQIDARFRAGYTKVYGRAPDHLAVEILNWHLTAEIPRRALTLAETPATPGDARAARKGTRPVFVAPPADEFADCPVYDRYRLAPGTTFPGPCIIEEREATVVVPAACTVRIDGWQNIIIGVEPAASTTTEANPTRAGGPVLA